MKFVSFQLNIALTEGKEVALKLESPFDEKDLVTKNQPFLFENMPVIKKVNVLLNDCEEANLIEGTEQIR